ncbi:MAG: HopJ type III effector protein [Gammaproteobacteria bacterium]
MSVEDFLNRLARGERIAFADTLALIAEHYRYKPVSFSTGVGRDLIENNAGVNEGSCKILAFARLHGLDQEATLRLFGDHYWIDVRNNPEKKNHPNIRNFIRYGWHGVLFSAPALIPKEPS